jgi:energy-converting hydrogenase A subunit M
MEDKDYLEMLMHKLAVMKKHGSQYYAYKHDVDKRLFEAARKDVNEFLTLLKKRGYSGERFNTPPPVQQTLL